MLWFIVLILLCVDWLVSICVRMFVRFFVVVGLIKNFFILVFLYVVWYFL